MNNKENIKQFFKEAFHPQDALLQELTAQELIDTVICNEAWHDIPRLDKVFEELLQTRINEAREMYNHNRDKIEKELIQQSPQYYKGE